MPSDDPGPLQHLALARDWEAALARGVYEVSTRGRTLAEEGFVHLCLPHQLAGVAARFYADATELLVRLTIDAGLLAAPVRLEPGDPSDPSSELFPHLYGPLPVAAVTAVDRVRVEGGRLVVG